MSEALKRRIEAEDILQEVAIEACSAGPEQDWAGREPRARLFQLCERRMVDAHARLSDKGALDPTGRMNAGELMGTRRLWDLVARDPRIWLDSCEVTHGPGKIAQEPRFCAVNSALEVDLTGQVNAESLGDSQVSGISGLFDLTLGATQSPGGRAIIAMPATAGDGARSRIVARLSTGARVTVPRHLADVVVTEHGVAELRGRSTEERARALIAIADPAFREALERTWVDQIRV